MMEVQGDVIVNVNESYTTTENAKNGSLPSITGVTVETTAIPTLVDLLRRDDCPDLQLEAACCLTNIIHDGTNTKNTAINAPISSQNDDDDNGDQNLTHIISGAIPQLVRLLGTSHSFHVREQVVCAIGTMARDSVKCRDAMLEAGVMQPLLELLDPSSTLSLSAQSPWCLDDQQGNYRADAAAVYQHNDQGDYHHCTKRKRSMQRCSTWTLAGLCMYKPSPDFNVIRTALPTLAKLLQYSNDEVVLKQACTTVACVGGGSMEKKQAVLAAGICPRLVALLGNRNVNISSSTASSSWHVVQEAAVRTLAIIMKGSPNHHPHDTQMVIQHVLECSNVLPLLRVLLDSPVTEIRRYTCWAICNITSGHNEHNFQAVIHHHIIPPLIHLFVHGDVDSRKQAFLTVLNTLARGTAQQVQYIVQQGCIAPIVDLLLVSDPTMIRVALVALESILRVGQEIVDVSPMAASTQAGSDRMVPTIHSPITTNPMVMLVCRANGLEKIRQLRQLFAHDFICTQCTRILQVYFDEVEIMDIAPAA
jgi:importin subunit alpha-6/7